MQYTFILGLFLSINDHEQSCYLSHQNIDILFVSCVFVSISFLLFIFNNLHIF